MSRWFLEPGHTAAEFRVRHMMVTHVRGHFKNVHGRLEFDPSRPEASTVTATIDAKGLWSGEPDRDAHLRSADFLDVIRYPTIVFRSTRVEQADGDHWKVTGDLTVRGTTRSVILDVQRSTAEGSRAIAHASTTIDRRDFGMTYANFAVGKQVAITIDAIGARTPADAPPW